MGANYYLSLYNIIQIPLQSTDTRPVAIGFKCVKDEGKGVWLYDGLS